MCGANHFKESITRVTENNKERLDSFKGKSFAEKRAFLIGAKKIIDDNRIGGYYWKWGHVSEKQHKIEELVKYVSERVGLQGHLYYTMPQMLYEKLVKKRISILPIDTSPESV